MNRAGVPCHDYPAGPLQERGRDDIAIALDTKGPEIRTGQLKEGSPVINH